VARPLRIEFPGALYHVTSRGNARAPIFLGEGDRYLLLDVLGDVVERYRWRCHAYCLMTNHYHLVVGTPEPNLSQGMRQLNGLYTQRLNRRHGRVGHVFQGRFKGILVERESHLLELARYVVLNPVRAGIVDAAENYRWSSLRATLGLAPAPQWLDLDALNAHFASRQHYLEFVREGVGAVSPWSALRGSLLGSEAFIERVGVHVGAKAQEREIPRRQRLVRRQRLDELFPPQAAENLELRNRRIRQASRECGYSLAEIARHLGVHYSTVSRVSAARREARSGMLEFKT
jgi:REP element-mobilizing transposase RayT